MKNFFGFEKLGNEGPKEIYNGTVIEKDESPKDTLRSEYDAHKGLCEGMAPKQVSEIINKYDKQLTDARMNIYPLRETLTDEYNTLSRMNFSEEEIKHELEQKLKQLLPRK